MTEYEALLNDERWQQAQEFIRQGAWHQALELLRELEKEYPDDTRLRSALMDVELRASLVEETTGEVHIPTRRRIPRRALTATVLIFVAIGLIITLYGGYQKYVAPAQVVAETQQELQQLYKEAQAALAQGDYQRAVDLFSQILQQAPEHEGAREGLEQARERLTLAQMYEEAMDYLEAGDKAKALALFRQIAEKDPEYRDVRRRISSLEKELTVQALFLQGETAFENGEWFTAISLFEEVRHLDGKYKKDIVRDRLYTAYYNYALEILATGEEDAPDRALEYVRKALSFNSRSEEARALRNDLMAYLRGRRAFAKGDYLTAVQKWAPLYERRPDFGNGMLARQLYRAYVELGKMREQEDNLPSAIHFYSLAVQLPVEDKSEAEERLSFLFLLITPTPTPTSTPTPTNTPTATPTPTVTPTPTATPTPTPKPLPLSAYPGWIAFKTDRRGVEEVWVMRPDGCCARPVADPENYEKIREKQSWSPDGKYRVYPESPGPSDVVDLYIWRYDVPENWQRKYLLVGNGSINYDPVYSPDGAWIAFVSEVTGGDEIWKVSSDFFNPKPPIRLTFNTWEWDKSPTWSPDGKYIAFWSNRGAGRKQIWVMNADGSNQHSISNNEYNDWDPVWLWPSYFRK